MKKYVLIFVIMIVILSTSSLIILTEPNTYVSLVRLIVEIIANLAATVGLLGLLYQFKREKDLSEANFTIQLNESFHNNSDIIDMYRKLELNKNVNQEINPFTDDEIIKLATYISFFEPFNNLIERKIIAIKSFDKLFSYKFFLAVNNKHVQEMILCKPEKIEAWTEIFRLHFIWKSYKIKSGLPLSLEINDLSKRNIYSEIINNENMA